MTSLTSSQTFAVEVTERVNASLSILSCVFIMSTYLFYPGFDKAINRLVFWVSLSTILMTFAPLVSASGMAAGPSSVLCLAQAFFVQMFLGVDAFWSLCMSINVYFCIFRGYSTKDLARFDYFYLLVCYGLSGVFAIVYLVLTAKGQAVIYGPAVIWCWIDIKYDYLRIATLYGLVWVSLLIALGIYIAAGRKVWQKRHLLRGILNPFIEDFYTCEVIVTSEPRESFVPNTTRVDNANDWERNASTDPGYEQYSAVVEAAPRPAEPPRDILRIPEITRLVAEHEQNSDAWLYARTAVFYYLALLIVWIPSSINRIYAFIRPTEISFGLNYASAFVFSLQGVFILLVYIITSQSACGRLWYSLRGSLPRKSSTATDTTGLSVPPDSYELRDLRRTSQRLDDDSNSVTFLAGNRLNH